MTLACFQGVNLFEFELIFLPLQCTLAPTRESRRMSRTIRKDEGNMTAGLNEIAKRPADVGWNRKHLIRLNRLESVDSLELIADERGWLGPQTQQVSPFCPPQRQQHRRLEIPALFRRQRFHQLCTYEISHVDSTPLIARKPSVA